MNAREPRQPQPEFKTAQPSVEQRKFRRIAVGTKVSFSGQPLDRISRDYLESITGNVSLGGMYLATTHTFRPGTLVHLRFDVVSGEREKSPIEAKAIVRWRRRLSKPRGMGVEFIEFEGLGKRRLEEWLTRLFPSPGRAPASA